MAAPRLRNGASRWITGEAARQDVQHWRARSSAILTGIGTVLADDPRLDVRLADEAGGRGRRQPLRVILDARLRTPFGARLLSTGGEVLILTALSAPDDARAASLTERGARVESLPAVGDRLVLAAVIERLGELEANEVLVEAGATLAGELLRQGLADELLLYVAPKLLGPCGACAGGAAAAARARGRAGFHAHRHAAAGRGRAAAVAAAHAAAG